ncbi:MAG TPA: GNAT family N-acetyltransferase [Candidatus Stackebrandtia faecavium]|nr:GNAT family N-acetyltransferase [Candidatus Stackebrandtia faecavium]
MTDAQSLLHEYDRQLRRRIPRHVPAATTVERVGPLVRVVGLSCGLIEPPAVLGVDGDDLDTLIAAQRDFFAERGEAVEWKLREHDLPTSLPRRLVTAGFVPQPTETVMIGTTAEHVTEVAIPRDVTIRRTTATVDMSRIADFESDVWQTDRSRLADDLTARVSAMGDDYAVFVAETGRRIVAAAWLEIESGTEFAGLWGGATAESWRGHGIYRAMVTWRAQLAHRRAIKYLQVDASVDSRPILQRLGFTAVTTTTPYVWMPNEVD